MEKYPFGRMGELVSTVSIRFGSMSLSEVATFEGLLRVAMPSAAIHVCQGVEVTSPYSAEVTCPDFIRGHVERHIAMLARVAMRASD
jgi:hypothetical protein